MEIIPPIRTKIGCILLPLWSDGKWTVTNPVVEIMVEPKATVNIIFKTPDGNVLENLGYTEYFDSTRRRY